MQDQHAHERQPRAPAGAVGAEPRIAPSSSRMLASYLADIEQLLDEQRWEAALREAFDLPEIAVALADPASRADTASVRVSDLIQNPRSELVVSEHSSIPLDCPMRSGKWGRMGEN